MKYKGLIFDLDGVICSTDEYHYKAWKFLANKLDIHFDEEKNNLLRGVSRMESLEIILGDRSTEFTDEQKIAMATEKNDVYRESLKQMTEEDLDQNVHKTLLKLKEDGYKLSIGSSSKNARFILERLGITNLFDEIVDGTDIVNSKPDPEVFIKASSQLQLKVEDCVVIEDAVAGVQAGLAGGFDVVAIGDATKSDLTSMKIKKFENLIELV